uniref:Tachykinin-related peptide 6 n=3 Tax=Rhodnius prolixus TaxID=13249 RepID=TRP6_RHOPR|nr:RecName: Full=Tachykinin-related peptide 6; Short=Rhopr-TRP-6 [Rhodnius prolixus]
GPSSSAFFGMR